MMSTERYNGWTNYETWLVNVWMSNDQGAYERWEEVATELVADNPDSARERLAEQLKDSVSDESPTVDDASLYADLLNAAICIVDWRELAEHCIADVEPDNCDAMQASERRMGA